MRSIAKAGTSLLATGVLTLLAACGGKPDSAPAQQAAAMAWPQFVEQWIESDLKANPTFAVYQGRHEFDGLFPDWSEAGLKAEIARLKEWRGRAGAYTTSQLAADAAFEREYLLAVIDERLFWLETADWPHRNPDWYSLEPGVYLDREYADLAVRMQAYTRWASNLPTAAAQIQANFKGPLPKAYIDIGLYTYGPLAQFLRDDVPKVFKGVGDAPAQEEFRKHNAAAVAALEALERHLTSLRATQTDQFALGPELFAKMLQATERVDTPLAELAQRGRADLERNKQALVEACAGFAPGKTLRECTARVKASKPRGGDAVAYAREQLDGLKRFIEEKKIVSIPGTEEARVKQSPPYNAQNSAYIDIPGPYEKNLPSYYNVAAPDPSWPKEKQQAYVPAKASLLFTSVHEVWPGHFLQFLHANRAKSVFGRLYVGYAFAEGWAHYAEELMWEEGLGYGDAEVRIGQLINALWRNARLLSAIGLHTQGMTLEESRRLFLEEAHLDEGNAEQQAARGAYDPAYLNYTMGKLMIRKLRSDWCATRGGAEDKNCWHQFHDAFLAYGGPPIPLVRAAMLGGAANSAF
jgi:hypothetical protein